MVYYIKYLDVAYFGGSSFIKESDLKLNKLPEIEVVGFIVEETDKAVYLAGQMLPDGMYNMVMEIPNEMIVELRPVEEGEVEVVTKNDARVFTNIKAKPGDFKDRELLKVVFVGFKHVEEDTVYISMERRKDRGVGYRTINAVRVI